MCNRLEKDGTYFNPLLGCEYGMRFLKYFEFKKLKDDEVVEPYFEGKDYKFTQLRPFIFRSPGFDITLEDCDGDSNIGHLVQDLEDWLKEVESLKKKLPTNIMLEDLIGADYFKRV